MKSYRGKIEYGKEIIEFSYLLLKRRTFEIAVNPDSSIIVKVPLGIKYEEIEKKVIKRAAWIKEQIAFFSKFSPITPPRQYISGETHLYLGRQYRLRVIKNNKTWIRLYRGKFEIACLNVEDRLEIKKILDNWYRIKAEKILEDRFDECWLKFRKNGFKKPKLGIRKMKKRWGSLGENEKLNLNIELIKVSSECIDYVITHELCHLKYRNHNYKFYRFLEGEMFDWEKRKEKLEMSLI